MFTGNLDTDILILSLLDNKALFNINKVNKYFHSLYHGDKIWQVKLMKEYSQSEKYRIKSLTFRETYRRFSKIPSEGDKIVTMIKRGYLDVLQWLILEDHLIINSYPLFIAVDANHPDMLDFIKSIILIDINDTSYLSHAINKKKLLSVEWLINNEFTAKPDSVAIMIREKHIYKQDLTVKLINHLLSLSGSYYHPINHPLNSFYHLVNHLSEYDIENWFLAAGKFGNLPIFKILFDEVLKIGKLPDSFDNRNLYPDLPYFSYSIMDDEYLEILKFIHSKNLIIDASILRTFIDSPIENNIQVYLWLSINL